MQRKSYTREFKIRAVQLMNESSKPIQQLAEELTIYSITVEVFLTKILENMLEGSQWQY